MQGSEMKALRKAAKMTQGELAEALELSLGYIGELERGEKTIDRRTELATWHALEEQSEAGLDLLPPDERAAREYYRRFPSTHLVGNRLLRTPWFVAPADERDLLLEDARRFLLGEKTRKPSARWRAVFDDFISDARSAE